MNAYVPVSHAGSDSGSTSDVTAFGAVPCLMPSTMSCSALTACGELIADLVPSELSTCPPAGTSRSGESHVGPSYAAPWYPLPPFAAACWETCCQVCGVLLIFLSL